MSIKNTLSVDIVVMHPQCEPSYAKPGDGAFDLRAYLVAPLEIQPGHRDLIGVGIKIAVPEGYAGMIIPRSGLANKYGVSVTNAPGLIDSGYRGELAVIVENRGVQAFKIEPFDRIAQFAIVPVYRAHFCKVDKLDDTARGIGGFGSSGVK